MVRSADLHHFDAVVRNDARCLLQSAIDAAVEAFLGQHAHRRDEPGNRQVVRIGGFLERGPLTGGGVISVEQGRARENIPGPEQRANFRPSVLSACLRKTEAIEELMLWRYLKGMSKGDLAEALQSQVGEW